MPRWEIHLAIAEKLNEKLKFQGKDREAFFLGNVLPDLNSGYLLPNVSKKIDKDFTHFYIDKEESYYKFRKKYSQEISEKQPIFLGYFTHLYTDYTWNEDFVKRIKGTPLALETNHDFRRILKQGDFWVFNNRFRRYDQKVEHLEHLISEASKIKEIYLTKEDIIQFIEYLNRGDLTADNLRFYKEEELAELFENTIGNLEKIVGGGDA